MTVVFLHGVSGSHATYDWLPDTLEGHRVVRPDFRGHGHAPRARCEYLIDDFGSDVLDVLGAEGPAYLVGHSLGGVAAWWAAQKAPDLVPGAFLEDPPLFMGEPAEHALNGAIPNFRVLRANAIAWQAERIDEPTAAARIAATPIAPGDPVLLGDVLTAEALAARAFAHLHVDPAVLDPVIDGSLLAATDVTSPVSVPVFLLAADEAAGSAFPARHESRLALSHPGVVVERLSGPGHSIHDERAHRDEYLARVVAFLSAHRTD